MAADTGRAAVPKGRSDGLQVADASSSSSCSPSSSSSPPPPSSSQQTAQCQCLPLVLFLRLILLTFSLQMRRTSRGRLLFRTCARFMVALWSQTLGDQEQDPASNKV